PDVRVDGLDGELAVVRGRGDRRGVDHVDGARCRGHVAQVHIGDGRGHERQAIVLSGKLGEPVVPGGGRVDGDDAAQTELLAVVHEVAHQVVAQEAAGARDDHGGAGKAVALGEV